MTEPSFTALKGRLVESLFLAGMEDENARTLLARELEALVGADLAIARSAVPRHDLLSIVNGALSHPGGLQALADIVVLVVGNGRRSGDVLEIIRTIDERVRDSNGSLRTADSAEPARSQQAVAMSQSTDSALRLAAGLARRRTGRNSVDATTALLGALWYAHSTSLPGVTSGLLQKLVARDSARRSPARLLHALEAAAGVVARPELVPVPAPFDATDRGTAELLKLAADYAVRLSGRERISLRHLLAATVFAEPPVDRNVLDELALDRAGLRQLLGEASSADPREPAERWAAVLGLPAPDTEMIPSQVLPSADELVVSDADSAVEDVDVETAEGDGDTFTDRPKFGGVGSYGFSDRRARSDLLAREKMASVLTSLIRDPAVGPDESDLPGPTVIAVEGPWGSGKTSLMGFISKQFETPELVDDGTRITARDALRIMSGRDDPPAASGAGGWVAAWFNPSVHQSSEQVWAGLARTILNTLDAALHSTTRDRERFWLRRNVSRLDARTLRRALWTGIQSPWFRLAVWAAALPVAVRLIDPTNTLYLFGYPLMSASTLALLIPLSLLAVAACGTWWRYTRHAASLYLPADVLRGPVLSGAHAEAGAGHSETLRDPLYQARSGYLYLSQHDVKLLLDEAGKGGTRLVVFIDDLDRCGPQTTADVLSAVNLFLSEELHHCRFVIGLDPAVVAAHIDQVYKELPDLVAAAQHDDPNPGWTFLRKLVQLPVPIPHIDDASVDRLLSNALGDLHYVAPDASEQIRSDATAVQADDVLVPIPIQQTSDPSPAEAAVLARDLEHSDRIRGLLRERLLDQPSRSVRETKRLVTVWVFYARLFAAIEPLPSADAEQRGSHLVLLAEIITRWPALQQYLSRRVSGRLGLAMLIDDASSDAEWERTVAKLGMNGDELTAPLNSLRRMLVDPRYRFEPVADLAARVL